MYGFGGFGVPLGSKRRGIFADPDPSLRRMALHSPEYQRMFCQFDLNQDGIWSLQELKDFLRWTKQAVEQGTRTQFYSEDFEDSVVVAMAGRFAGGERMQYNQFVELLIYVLNIKDIFRRYDVDASGAIDFSELVNALRQSGWTVSNAAVMERICCAYDQRGTRQLEFDEFLNFRLQWDVYITAWERFTLPGSDYIQPRDLIKVLDDIKASMGPVMRLGRPTMMGLLPLLTAGNLFQPRVCNRLIMRFGGHRSYLSFEDFCSMMEYLSNLQQIFHRVDSQRDGRLTIADLDSAFTMQGVLLPRDALMHLYRQYDTDGSSTIEFDEFVLIMMNEVEERQHSIFHLPFFSMPLFSLQRIFLLAWSSISWLFSYIFSYIFWSGPCGNFDTGLYGYRFSWPYDMTNNIGILLVLVTCYLLCALWGYRTGTLLSAVLAVLWALRWPLSFMVRMIWGAPVVAGLT